MAYAKVFKMKLKFDVIKRDEVMGMLWGFIFKEQSFESQKAFAYAYCRVREMGYHDVDEESLK